MPYIAGARCSPGNMVISDEDLIFTEFPDSVDEARWKDVYCLIAMQPCAAPPKHPVIHKIKASLTELSTVYTLLEKAMEMGQEARIRRDHHCYGISYKPKSKIFLETTRRVQQRDPEDVISLY